MLYDIGRIYEIHRQKMELSDNKNPQQKLGSVVVAGVAPKTLTRVSQTLVPNGQPMLRLLLLLVLLLILSQRRLLVVPLRYVATCVWVMLMDNRLVSNNWARHWCLMVNQC